jgi:hypothetical protein
MGPCVRRDDPPRACARPRPHQRVARFTHMRFPVSHRERSDCLGDANGSRECAPDDRLRIALAIRVTLYRQT